MQARSKTDCVMMAIQGFYVKLCLFLHLVVTAVHIVVLLEVKLFFMHIKLSAS